MIAHQLSCLLAFLCFAGAGMVFAHALAAPLRRRALREHVARALHPEPLQLPAPRAPIQSHVRLVLR